MRRSISLLLAGALALGIAAPAMAAPDEPSIVDIASGNADFEILTTAVVAAGLDGTLDGRRQFTVFAPTDDAFLALEAACPGILGALLADTDSLTKVLLYHVAPGAREAADVSSDRIRMLNKQFAAISTDGGPAIDGVDIVATDIMARNGVIHVIDGVLVPAGLPSSVLALCN
jgi:uncharacterized surface protein with fasciclin (FAS1) repeats